jgi:hemerythrin
MSFAWSPELATGYTLIDAQHKQLFAAADALFNACQIGKERQEVEKTMKFLLEYTIKHFTDEEALQKKYDYPDYPAHKQTHVRFAEQVRGLAAKFPREGPIDGFISEVYITVGEWLLSHLRDEDFRMAAYIQDKEQLV